MQEKKLVDLAEITNQDAFDEVSDILGEPSSAASKTLDDQNPDIDPNLTAQLKNKLCIPDD